MLVVSTLLFTGTAVVGVVVAVDRAAAVDRFTLMLLGLSLLVILPLLTRINPPAVLGLLGFLAAAVAGGLSVLFFLFNNWGAVAPGDFTPFQAAGLWIQANRPTFSILSDATLALHSNQVAQVLVILIPLGVGGCIQLWRRGRWILALLSSPLILTALAAHVMTFSRGGWGGLLLGIICALILIWQQTRPARSVVRVLAGGVFGLVLLLVVGAFLLAVSSPAVSVGHAQVWRDSLGLLRDYWFTGSGLNDQTMVFSSYAYLLHVPFLAHAHNLFLQIGLEQGVPGVIAFGGMTVAALGLSATAMRHQHDRTAMAAASAAALVGLFVHGLLDSEGYVTFLLPLFFVPFAFASALNATPADLPKLAPYDRPEFDWGRVGSGVAGVMVPVVALLVLCLMPGAAAQLQANLGAVAQTQAELSVYRWPEWPSQDKLRQEDGVELVTALSYYEQALRFDGENASANRRLGQILLSQGDYGSALAHLATAYNAAPENRATRQLLGEAHAVSGDVQEAEALWRAPDVTVEKLIPRRLWYESIGAEAEVEYISQTFQLLSAPE